MECTTLSPIVKRCTRCGTKFTPANRQRKYCKGCCAQMGRSIAIRQCGICWRDVEVVCSSAKTVDATTKVYCVECRRLRDQPKTRTYRCQSCGKDVLCGTRGPAPTLCSACNQAKRNRAMDGKCQWCGGGCKAGSKACKECHENGHGKRLEPKPCSVCGEMFQPKTNKRKYCDRRECAIAGIKQTLEGLHGNSRRFVCLRCGEEYKAKSKDRDTFCSRGCAFAWVQENPMLGPEPAPKPTLACEICGQPASNTLAKTCGPACRAERNRRIERQRGASRTTRASRPCKQCGKMFVPEYGNRRKSYCSDKCGKKADRRKRKRYTGTLNNVTRKRLRSMHGESWGSMYEPINKQRVFERDKWRCQLCRCKVKRTQEWDPRQATIDHIIPIVLGGEHKYANVQTACMECNSRKGATIQGQQRLFG
jgi:5-methylcytosine-specific restriction endonuclease McrA